MKKLVLVTALLCVVLVMSACEGLPGMKSQPSTITPPTVSTSVPVATATSKVVVATPTAIAPVATATPTPPLVVPATPVPSIKVPAVAPATLAPTVVPTAMVPATAVPPTSAPTIEPTKAPEATKVSEPTKAPTTVVSVTATPAITACRHLLWVTEAISNTANTAELVAVLERDFVESEGGQWSEAGYTVPAGTVFWTDLFDNAKALPAGVKIVRNQGGWGVYSASTKYVISKPNGGGRFMRICEGVADISVTAPVAQETPQASTKPVCITDTEVGTITGNADPGKEYDRFYEGKGYQYGKSFQNGDTAPVGWLLHANGRVYKTSVDEKLPEGGRGMPVCNK